MGTPRPTSGPQAREWGSGAEATAASAGEQDQPGIQGGLQVRVPGASDAVGFTVDNTTADACCWSLFVVALGTESGRVHILVLER